MSDDAPWLTPDEIRAWLSLACLIEALPPLLSAQLKRDAGLNSYDYLVLAGLSESPNRTAGMSDLAAFAAGSISRLSHALTKMERRGWVQRRLHPRNGRHTEVTLTDEGFSVVSQAAPGHVRMVRRFVVDQLGPVQTLQLGRLCDQILADVAPDARRVLTERYGHPPRDYGTP